MTFSLPIPRFMRSYIAAVVAENMVGFARFVDSAVASISSSAAKAQNQSVANYRDKANGVVGIDATMWMLLNQKQLLSVDTENNLILINTDLLPQEDPHVKGALWWNSLFFMISNG